MALRRRTAVAGAAVPGVPGQNGISSSRSSNLPAGLAPPDGRLFPDEDEDEDEDDGDDNLGGGAGRSSMSAPMSPPPMPPRAPSICCGRRRRHSDDARLLRPLQAATWPCRPRRASGPALRQAQTVHWTVRVQAQPTASPSARAPDRRCSRCKARYRATLRSPRRGVPTHKVSACAPQFAAAPTRGHMQPAA